MVWLKIIARKGSNSRKVILFIELCSYGTVGDVVGVFGLTTKKQISEKNEIKSYDQ